MSEIRITSTELGDAATSETGGQVRVTSFDGGNGIVQSVVAGTNVTVDSTDPAHPVVSATGGGGGGGAVDSVNGQTGVVVLAASDVGADASGAAAAAQAAAIAASQPLDTDLTAIAALSTTSFGRALLTLADAAALRTSAGLGTAAVAATGDFDAAGAAAAAQAASQPLDSDLTAIAALTTTSYGRAFLALADAAAGRTALGLGTAATSATTAFDAAGAAAAAQAASQPLDSDLTSIAALTTTSYGRAFLALADAAAGRTALGLGTAATSASTDFQPVDSDLTAIAALTTTSFGRSFLALADAAAGRTLLGLGTLATQSGTFSGTSSGTNTGDQTITLTGDATGSGTGSFAVNVAKLNGTALSGLATGLLKNTTTTGVPSIAAAADVPTVAAGGTGPLSASDASTTNSRTPTAHHTSHESGGSDAVSLAASQITSGVLAIGRLATGTPDGTKFLRDDGTLAVPGGASDAKYKGAFSPSTSYAVGDTVTSNGLLYGCTTAFTPAGTPTFVGGSSVAINGAGGGTVALPTGSLAGDLVVYLQHTWSSAPVLPTGVTQVLAVADGASRFAKAGYKTLTSADITAGTLTIPAQPSASSYVVMLQGFRNGGAVDVVNSASATFSFASPVVTPSAAAWVVMSAGEVTASGSTITCPGLTALLTQPGGGTNQMSAGSGYNVVSSGSSTARTFAMTGAFTNPIAMSIPVLQGIVTPTSANFDIIGVAPTETINAVASSGTTRTLPDIDTARVHYVTLTGACTLTFPNATAGKKIRVALKQDGVGSRTVTWPGTVTWPNGTTPTLTTTAGATDHFEFISYDGTNWLGRSLGTPVDPIAKSIGTTKGDQIGFTGSGAPVRHAIGADGTVQTADSTQADGWKWSAPGVFSGFYGDGSDGNVTVTGGTTTLTRAMYYDTLTISGTGVLKPNGFRVFCKTALIVQASGILSANGNNASGATGGTTSVNGSSDQGGGGPAGATGVVGVGAVGTAASNSYGGASGAGGAGTSGAGGAVRVANAPGSTAGSIRHVPAATQGTLFVNAGFSAVNGGAGASAGAGDGTSTGGGGGGGGGVLVLNARAVTNSGTISANGGDGGNSAAGNTGGGGGGGGGVVIINTSTALTGSSPIVNGGAGGSKQGTGVAGSAGSAGTVFVNVWS